MKTICQKCIFADFANSDNSCIMDIPTKIQNLYPIEIDEKGFNIINDYRCLYGFDLSVYEKHKSDIGSVDQLMLQINDRCKVPYYLVIILKNDSDITSIVNAVTQLIIKPKYISVITFEHNNTKNLIDVLNQLNNICEWKLHNFLQKETVEKAINVVFDTNARNNDSQYAWIIESNDINNLNQNITNINNILTVTKPVSHMLCKNKEFDLNGLFIAFDNYKILCKENQIEISDGIKARLQEIIIYPYIINE